MESIEYDFDKNELNSDEMAICPSLESDLRALVSQVPRDMLPWLAGIAVEQAVRT